MNLVHILKHITELEIKLDEVYSEARNIDKELTAAKKELQDNCEHPEQLRDKIVSKGQDPLEADRYKIYCHLCGKKLDGSAIWR